MTTKNGKRYASSTEIGTGLGDADLSSAQLAPGEAGEDKLAFDLPAAERFPLFVVGIACYLFAHQRKEVVRICSHSSCGTLEVLGR